jgi:glycerol-3-phosphate dehydrogenase
LRINGYHPDAAEFGTLSMYGSDAALIQELIRDRPELSARLHPALPYVAAEVVWAVRTEMARTIDDVLSRRLRALPLNARAALEMAEQVASLMGREMEQSEAWKSVQMASFQEAAKRYIVS